jgi:hypothetical protein
MRRLLMLAIFPLSLMGFNAQVASAADSEMEGFFERMSPIREVITDRADSPPAQIFAYNSLEKSLNKEMERAFNLVMTKMKPSERAKMTESQHLWEKQRENEYQWMDRAYGPVVPQSKEHLRIVELRSLMMNARVMQLYSYLDTLPDAATKLASSAQGGSIAEADNGLKIATIIGFSLGESACFLDLKDEKRKSFTEVSSSAFCQRESQLLDKKVALTYKLGSVSGATCAVESVDCAENNMLVLVSDAKIIRPKRRP